MSVRAEDEARVAASRHQMNGLDRKQPVFISRSLEEGEATRMQRVATFMMVREGMEEAYREAHRAVWPEILAGIERAGIKNYTIFMLGRQLFSYFEVDDLGAAMALVRADPVNQLWQEKMAPLMEVTAGVRDQSTVYLDEVFHHD